MTHPASNYCDLTCCLFVSMCFNSQCIGYGSKVNLPLDHMVEQMGFSQLLTVQRRGNELSSVPTK